MRRFIPLLRPPSRAKVRLVERLARPALFLLLASSLAWSAAAEGDNLRERMPLGVTDFDFSRQGDSEADQVQALTKLGFTGMTLKLDDDSRLIEFDRYRDAIKGTNFRIYAGYIPATFTSDQSGLAAHLEKALPRLKSVGASLWLIVRNTELTRDQILEELRKLADQSQAAGVELVLYPHAGTRIETAEDALTYINDLNHPNVFVSLHMCHEVRAGNGDRLTEIARKIKPWLRLPSINGADTDFVGDASDQSRLVKPLGQGAFDATKQIRALDSIHYQGPVILLTYGLRTAPADHHQTSIQTYREILDTVGEESKVPDER